MELGKKWGSVRCSAFSVAENCPERYAYNEFIRTTGLIAGCIDFDKTLQAPQAATTWPWRSRRIR